MSAYDPMNPIYGPKGVDRTDPVFNRDATAYQGAGGFILYELKQDGKKYTISNEAWQTMLEGGTDIEKAIAAIQAGWDRGELAPMVKTTDFA